MAETIQSICAIGLIMVVGWVARRFGALNDGAVGTLTEFVYWIATPALLFTAISNADLDAVIGRPLLVAAVSGVGSAFLFVLLARLIVTADGAQTAVGAMSASLNNAGHIGIPIALYILGDTSHAVPIMVFQLGLFSPMFFVLVDVFGRGTAPTLKMVARSVVTNPMVIAGIFGFICSWLRLTLPQVITVTMTMLGQAAPPVVLIAFGASLYRASLSLPRGVRSLIAGASVSKLVVQPLIAMGVAYTVGLRGDRLLAVTVMASLPTAQNAFVAAQRAHAGEEIARDTVLITTIASLPLTVFIVWFFQYFALG